MVEQESPKSCAYLAIIRPLNRLLLRLERAQHRHRPKYLLPDNHRVVLHVGEHGRLDEESLYDTIKDQHYTPWLSARKETHILVQILPSEQHIPLRLPHLDIMLNLIMLDLIDLRPVRRFLVHRTPNDGGLRLDSLLVQLRELLGDGGVDVKTRCTHAL